MKNKYRFLLELAITIIVAVVLNNVVIILLSLIAGGMNQAEQWQGAIYSAGNILFGLIVGYKLHSLLCDYKKQ